MSDLRIRILADLDGFKAAFGQAQQQVRSSVDGMRQSFAGVNRATADAARTASSSFGQVAARLGAMVSVYAGVQAVRAFAQMSDEAALATARINGITGSMEQTRAAQAGLFEMAQRLQAPYMEVQASFARMLPIVKQLGGGIQETTRLTEILTTTAKLSGASAAEASASAMQFAQALSSGTLQGDELRSILENNNTLARTLADGMGVTVGELRKLGEEGKLTADLVGNTLLKSYDDIKAKAGELPGTVGGAWTQVTNAFQQYVAASENSAGVFAGLSLAFSEVAKVITAMTEAFGRAGNESSKLGGNTGAKDFASGVGTAFAWLVDVISAAVRFIVEGVKSIVNAIATAAGATIGLGKAIAQVASGDFSGAADTMRTQASLVRDAWVQSTDWITNGVGRMVDAVAGAGPTMAAYLAPRSAQAGGDGGPSAALTGARGSTDTGVDKAAEKAAQAAIREAERAAREQERIQDRLLESERQADLIRMGMAEQTALAAIDSEERVAEHKVRMGEMTDEQLLQQQLSFEQRRYEIRAAAAQQQLELARMEGRDPEEVARINAQLLDLELQYQAARQQINLQMAESAQQNSLVNVWQSAQSAMQRSVQSMLQGAATLRQGMASAWAGIRSTIIGELSKIMVAKVANWAKEKALALAGITANAAEGGSAAAKSVASIPYVGPILAVAALATVFASIMGMQGKIASAAGGYDIPAGINPVTQLHAQEMVLPAEHANTIRELSANGGGQAGEIKVEIRGASAGDFFIAHKSELAKALKAAHRGFAFA